ncbi:methyltransferase domain-containing protein [Pseudomonas sp. GL-RE-29]|jgi:hypothetical protein|uniref:methyltransferase domain-containing protein n=1 Tax=Pseudomonas sp. GL-RE-29 TaxID=2832375 RepID=UPI001CBF4140|nr:methyltransferase domain-containing protein [Pseudomonas sp. GL-RE-29]
MIGALSVSSMSGVCSGAKDPVGDVSSIKGELNVQSEYFIGDFLSLHGAKIGRRDDVKQIMTYHSDNNDWSITSESKDALITSLLGLLPAEGAKIHNRVFLEAVRDWYCGLDSGSKIDNAVAAKDHLDRKGHNIARMILEANYDLGGSSVRVLDVGGNDGILTSNVAYHLGQSLNVPVQPYVLEIETGVSWDHNSNTVSAADNNKNEPVKTIYYDGRDMSSGRVFGPEDNNPLADGRGFDCAMYQHSLHHFPSPEIQQESLKQIFGLLNDGGVLTISEHGSALGSSELDLMHMMTEVYSDLHRDPQMSVNELEERYNAYVERETPANYFSQESLRDMARKAGFTPVSVTGISERTERTYSMTFVKNAESILERHRDLNALLDSDALKADVTKFETKSIYAGVRSLDGVF